MVCGWDTDISRLLLCNGALWVDPAITQWLQQGTGEPVFSSNIIYLKPCMIIVKHMIKKKKKGCTNSVKTKSFPFTDVLSHINYYSHRNIKPLLGCLHQSYVGYTFVRLLPAHICKHIHIVKINLLLEIQKWEEYLVIMLEWNRALGA